MNKFIGSGQINMNSEFGNYLYKIASLEDVNNIFEVGTWNGQGSTVCIMNGIIDKEKSCLYSIEADLNMYNQALNFWNGKDTKNKVYLLNGTLHKKMAEDVPTDNEQINWYIGEQHVMSNAKVISIENINDIDLILLDGGEFTSQGDFDILIKKNPKYIALDDVNCYKCNKIRSNLILTGDWLILHENLNDRNGWSILKNKNL
jgi:hypothetical protein